MLTRKKHAMPAFIKTALESEGVINLYHQRPPYQQNDYIGWINRAKRDETKQKRLRQMLAEHLRKVTCT